MQYPSRTDYWFFRRSQFLSCVSSDSSECVCVCVQVFCIRRDTHTNSSHHGRAIRPVCDAQESPSHKSKCMNSAGCLIVYIYIAVFVAVQSLSISFHAIWTDSIVDRTPARRTSTHTQSARAHTMRIVGHPTIHIYIYIHILLGQRRNDNTRDYLWSTALRSGKRREEGHTLQSRHSAASIQCVCAICAHPWRSAFVRIYSSSSSYAFLCVRALIKIHRATKLLRFYSLGWIVPCARRALEKMLKSHLLYG